MYISIRCNRNEVLLIISSILLRVLSFWYFVVISNYLLAVEERYVNLMIGIVGIVSSFCFRLVFITSSFILKLAVMEILIRNWFFLIIWCLTVASLWLRLNYGEWNDCSNQKKEGD